MYLQVSVQLTLEKVRQIRFHYHHNKEIGKERALQDLYTFLLTYETIYPNAVIDISALKRIGFKWAEQAGKAVRKYFERVDARAGI